ncbi:exodeoxyribonuclease VII large subunit [Candidatus Aenigmatarchaeota archaeon]
MVMLSDSAIAKICLLIVVIGIIILYFLTQIIEPVEMSVTEITRDHVGQKVAVSGYVVALNENDGHYFFMLIEEPERSYGIQAVLFNNKANTINTALLGNGEFITVHGEVALYQNNIEIIVEDVK